MTTKWTLVDFQTSLAGVKVNRDGEKWRNIRKSTTPHQKRDPRGRRGFSIRSATRGSIGLFPGSSKKAQDLQADVLWLESELAFSRKDDGPAVPDSNDRGKEEKKGDGDDDEEEQGEREGGGEDTGDTPPVDARSAGVGGADVVGGEVPPGEEDEQGDGASGEDDDTPPAAAAPVVVDPKEISKALKRKGRILQHANKLIDRGCPDKGRLVRLLQLVQGHDEAGVLKKRIRGAFGEEPPPPPKKRVLGKDPTQMSGALGNEFLPATGPMGLGLPRNPQT